MGAVLTATDMHISDSHITIVDTTGDNNPARRDHRWASDLGHTSGHTSRDDVDG
jgi:hypothetical protein